jgi:hypothetical protein
VTWTGAYRAAIRAAGRPERELEPVYPQGWSDRDRPRALLVLVGGRVFQSGDWPAIALVLGCGTYALGHTIQGAAFPRTNDLPRIFEGSQCFLDVGDAVQITRDVSTNGTIVIPASEVRKVPTLLIHDELRKRWEAACPKTVSAHDVILTMYAELALVVLDDAPTG